MAAGGRPPDNARRAVAGGAGRDDRGGAMAIETSELRDAIGRVLAGRDATPRAVARLTRRASESGSSYVLEEVDVELGDGRVFRLVVKALGRAGLRAEGRRAKPAFRIDPLREIAVYRDVLTHTPGVPRYYGAVVDPGTCQYWLVLENVDGRPLAESGDFSDWLAASRWLSAFHGRFAGGGGGPPGAAVPHTDPASFRVWLDRAEAFGRPARRADRDRVAAAHRRAVDRLAEAPATLIHGEFYAANILLRSGGGVCPVDWETASVGPGVLDLAALGTGWPARERAALADAYRAAGRGPGAGVDGPGGWTADLDAARLLLAVQWLGWSGDWSPPARQAHDWEAEALASADALDLR